MCVNNWLKKGIARVCLILERKSVCVCASCEYDGVNCACVCATDVRVQDWEPRVGGKRRCWRCSPGSTLWCGWPDAWTRLQHQTPAGRHRLNTRVTTVHLWPGFNLFGELSYSFTSSSSAPPSTSPWRVLMEPSSATSGRLSSSRCCTEPEICQKIHPTQEKRFKRFSQTQTHHLTSSYLEYDVFTCGLPEQEERDRTQGQRHQDPLHHSLHMKSHRTSCYTCSL